MNRITDKHLTSVRDRIAKLLRRPESNFITKPNGGLSAQVGSLLIESGSRTNGITWKLSEITNEGGGQHDLLRATSARDLFNMMLAFEAGIKSLSVTP